jgi:serine/threonine protein kinase
VTDTKEGATAEQNDDTKLDTLETQNPDAQEPTPCLESSGVSGDKKEEGPPRSRLKMFKNALRLEFQEKFLGNREDGQVFYRVETEDPDEGILYQKISGTFRKMYEKKDRLGEGTVGMVYKYTKRATGVDYAVKIMKTRDEEMIYQIKEEFRFMRELDHENIIKVYELYIDTDHARVYLVMEYMKGIEMFEYIQKIDHYKEEDAKLLFRKFMTGIEY